MDWRARYGVAEALVILSHGHVNQPLWWQVLMKENLRESVDKSHLSLHGSHHIGVSEKWALPMERRHPVRKHSNICVSLV